MTITNTDFNFLKQRNIYKGKVRDVYTLTNDRVLMVATDRLSAFDVVMPKGIPFKGQILNQIATKMMKATEHIVPNWLIDTPDPNVAYGYACEPFKVEMVIRGYMAGHAAREYKLGKRELCGIKLPDGLKENDKFDSPIITPATKAEMGNHDEDIAREDIIKRNIISEDDYNVIEDYTYKLFDLGAKIAKKQGLILVDTKYEFGKTKDGKIVLIDEIHTPDSSRYFYSDNYQELQDKGEPQKQLSKEFVRQWLIANNFQGLNNQQVPNMTDAYIKTVSDRYIELYEKIIGEPFIKADVSNINYRIETNVLNYLKNS